MRAGLFTARERSYKLKKKWGAAYNDPRGTELESEVLEGTHGHIYITHTTHTHSGGRGEYFFFSF